MNLLLSGIQTKIGIINVCTKPWMKTNIFLLLEKKW